MFQCQELAKLERDAQSAMQKINDTLMQVFGHDSIEYNKTYKIRSLYSGGIIVMGRAKPDYEYVSEYHDGIKDAVATLNTAVEMLEERLEDIGASPEAKARRAIDGLELHTEIERAAGQLYRNGHYANAIEDAVKALNSLVKLRSGVEQDGVTLMQQAFSPKAPVLKFNELADESDRNEQQGFMQLFCGAVTGLRNPRAHKIINDDPEEAVEFLAFISLLAKLLDKAKKA
jgi:uncharacterized protein (TIGR02391 family)